MSPSEVARAVRLRLAAEVDADRASLALLATSIRELRSAPGDPRTDAMRALALAFQLERFYTAIEATLSRVLRTIDGDVPSGGDSHHELLRAASVAVDGLRPAVVPQHAVADLKDLLSFRHYARHGYDVTVKPRRVEELAVVCERAHPILDASLAALAQDLRVAGA